MGTQEGACANGPGPYRHFEHSAAAPRNLPWINGEKGDFSAPVDMMGRRGLMIYDGCIIRSDDIIIRLGGIEFHVGSLNC
ncbi:hypothetical protein D9M68_1003600 [compost metagenome]